MYYSEFGSADQRKLRTGLTAAGTNLATALQLTARFNVIGTAAASTGVRLPRGIPQIGEIRVVNRGANTITVYPPTSAGKINGGSAGAGVTLATNASLDFVSDGNGNFWSF